MELLAQQRHTDLLERKLKCDESISGGILVRVRKLQRQMALSRVANISGFVDNRLAVVQTTRPNLYYHYNLGLNTGSQGKSDSLLLAEISATMEAAETFCSEARCPELVRARFHDLRKTVRAADPYEFLSPDFRRPKGLRSRPITWTRALHWDSKTEVWIPAEVVYSNFSPEVFSTHSIAPTSTAGLGAGFDSEHAILKATYEIYEHHLRSRLSALDVTVEKIDVTDRELAAIGRTSELPRLSPARLDTHFYSIHWKGAVTHIPFVLCVIEFDERVDLGWGLNLDPIQAVERAYLEAVQSIATDVSGARENQSRMMTRPEIENADYERRFEAMLPDEPTISLREFRDHEAAGDAFTSGTGEHAELLRRLARNGFKHVFYANLSRVGLDCVVVRCVVPGLESNSPASRKLSRFNSYSHEDIIRWQYLID